MGGAIPHAAPRAYDFARLERAVAALLRRHAELTRENAEVRRQLVERERRIRTLEFELREGNQKRQDVGKRIEELIAQLDQLDAHFGPPGD